MSSNFPEIHPNAKKVLQKRYYWKNPDGSFVESTPEELFERVAVFNSRAELKFKTPEKAQEMHDRAYEMMRSLRWMPNTPTLANSGRDRGQLAACYVLPIEDSMEGIMDALKNQALVQKSGGGTGFNFGNIRERGALVKSTGHHAAGPIPVIKLMNYMMSEFITQGGIRNGANMGVLPDDHPDIEEFITFKHVDGSCASFNVSVAATDKFMHAVVNDLDWDLKSRVDGKTKKTIKARTLFNHLVTSAWSTGDPGLLFIDAANRANPTPHVGYLSATNPCVTGETLIATENGLQPIVDIVRGKSATKALSPSGELEDITKYIDSGVKKVYKVTTRRGYSVRATDNHRWPTEAGVKETKDLVTGDVVTLQPKMQHTKNDQEFSLGELVGWLIGDGYLSHMESKSRMAGIVVGGPDAKYVGHINDLITKHVGHKAAAFEREEFNTTQLLSSRIWTWAVKDMGIIPHKAGEKEVPSCINTASMSTAAGFLRGLFSADGHVVHDTNKGNYGVRLTSKSEALVSGAQVLLSRFGIYCTKYDRSREPREELFKHVLPDGSVQKYGSDGKCYELSITGSAIRDFAKEIGFTQDYKTEKLEQVLGHNLRETSRQDEIVSIELDGAEETFCLTIEPTHRMCANGIVISNCGEQWLLPNEACTLGHHNLAMYVDAGVASPNWEDKFDWKKYEEDIYWGVRFLDNVIELNHYATPDIEKMHRQTNRKIGLGVMGFADMLIMLGIPYASDKARGVADKIASFHRKHADLASHKLGKERGSFGSFEGSEVQKEGWSAMRNACRTTVAPTGTTAIIAGCSTSIEPVFGLLLRREQAGMIMYESHPLFEGWINSLSDSKRNSVYDYYFTHNSLMGCLDVPEDIQQLFVQANDIHYKDHVLMQAVWQKYIDNSISKTINLPNSASEDDVRHAYILAWQNGCKGITVYRDGCRSHQALSTQKKAEPKVESVAPASAAPAEDAAVANYSDAEGQLCPECKQNTLEMGGGCESCKSCGFSACHIS